MSGSPEGGGGREAERGGGITKGEGRIVVVCKLLRAAANRIVFFGGRPKHQECGGV